MGEDALTIVRSKITLNAVTGGDGGDAQGGGAFHFGALSTTDSTITLNTVTAGDGGNGAGVGGAAGPDGVASGPDLAP